MNIREIGFIRKIVYLCRDAMERYSIIKGRGNRIRFKGVKFASRISVTGNGNIIIGEKGCLLKKSVIKIVGNNNTVLLRKNCYVSGAELWIEDNNCRIDIGENSYVGHHSHFACTEDGSQLIIGSEGMISSYVQVRTGDSHSILDMEGHRINPAASITIGKHVWLCEGSKVLKGVTLGDNIVVSTGAIVTKSFDNNVLLAGIPAKIIKENITWDSRRL